MQRCTLPLCFRIQVSEVLVLCYHFRTTIINGISLEDDPLNLVNETISVGRGGYSD